MQANDYLNVFKRRWPIVLVGLLLGVLTGVLTADEDGADESFTATHTLSVLQPSPLGAEQQQEKPTLTPKQVAVFATLGEVPRAAAEELEYDGNPLDLAEQVQTRADEDVGTVELTVTGSNAARAAAIANAFGSATKEVLSGDYQEALDSERQTAQAEVANVQNQINGVNQELALNPLDQVLLARRDALINQYRIAYDRYQDLANEPPAAAPLITLQEASPRAASPGLALPSAPVPRSLLLGALGLLLGAVVALVVDRLDTRIRTKEDVEALMGFPVIAEVPTLHRRFRNDLMTVTAPSSPFAEAYRILRTNLDFLSAADAVSGNGGGAASRPGGRVVLVTSPSPAEGKTTSVAHLAACYAETNRKVTIFDCDFRRPRLHRIFDVPERPGLSDALVAATPHADEALGRATGLAGVQLVPAGTPTDNPAHLLTRAPRPIQEARRQNDVVLLDSPPFLTANDAGELIAAVDRVLVVVRMGRTLKTAADRLGEQLQRRHAPVAGIVLVGARSPSTKYGSYYYRARSRSRGRRSFRHPFRGAGEHVLHDAELPRAEP
ncbi:MAG TPA: CpsD/CapB family tyrosine-protein kinase, partial [Acidimicrobiales bacterium]|nr:CpsD/CapB family tyrosine-protein kinase [Acidimicrobiales bacterium]